MSGTPKVWTPLSFEEWLAENPDILEDQAVWPDCGGKAPEECPSCEGEGTIECDECGQDRECPLCEGEGTKVCETCGGCGDPMRRARAAYAAQLKADKAALAHYQADLRKRLEGTAA